MDRWSQLSLKDKSDLMSLYIRNGINSLEEIKKHYNNFATGGSMSPDHDPDNPYHYHNAKGEKVVITPEEWEANVGKPYFKEIEDAVRAEQAAYPEPEYEINPNFVRDLRSTYASNMGYGYQNYRNFQHNLPQGYSFTPEGVIIGPDGTAYVQSGYRQSPRFTYSTDNPLQFTIYKGKPIEKNLTFYPVNMNRTATAPQPVDRTWKAPQLPPVLENLSPEALKFIEKKYYEGNRLYRYWTDPQEQLKQAAKYGIDPSRLRTISYKPTTNEWQGVATPFYALPDDFVIDEGSWLEGTPKEAIDFFNQYPTLGDFRRATGIKQLPLNGKYEEVKLPKIFKDSKDKYATLLQVDDDLVQEQRNKYFGFANGGHLYQDGGPDSNKQKQVKAPTWLEMWNHRNDEHYMTDKYSPQELDILRRRLYANLLPYNYPLREFKKAMDNPNTSYDKNSYPAERLEKIPSIRSIEFRDEQWAKYLGIPKELQRNRVFGDHISLSEYKPTVSKESTQYYKIDGDDIAKRDVSNNLIRLYNDFRTNKVLDEDEKPIQPTKNGNYNTVNSLIPISRSNYGKYLTQLGDFTVGSGVDSKKGQYVSYYDSWGLNPLKGANSRYPILTKIVKSSNREDLTQGLGNPFEFYDRIYLDDYYGMSSKPAEPNTYYGGWLPEIDITTEKR